MIAYKKGEPSIDSKRWGMIMENMFMLCKTDDDMKVVKGQMHSLVTNSYLEALRVRNDVNISNKGGD